MNIALMDVDGHNFPNLALMKLSAWHKVQGDSVEWYSPLFSNPDRIYASKVFTFSPDYLDYAPNHPEPIKGGTGYPIIRYSMPDTTGIIDYNLILQKITKEHRAWYEYPSLPDEIENFLPDFTLYPQYQAAYGFLTRGCIRQCEWCIVPWKEGAIREVSSIEKVAAGRSEVVLMDNNFLAAEPDFIERQLMVAAQLKLKLDFNQGLDARLVTARYARLLAACRWNEPIRFSCDSMAMIEPVKNAILTLLENGIRRKEFFIYLLVRNDIDEAESRLNTLMSFGQKHQVKISPFAQPYRDYTGRLAVSEEQRRFGRFVNIKGGKMCLKMRFKDYKDI